MAFIIAGILFFNPEDGALTHTETGESIKLTITAARLLDNILRSEAQLLSREMLLKEVWDDHGFQGSNSSLNQYISILRRSLAALGLSDVIITVPKAGFRINPAVSVARLAPPHADIQRAEEPAQAAPVGSRQGKAQTVLVSLLLLVSAAGAFYFAFQPDIFHSFRLFHDRLNEECSVVFMKDIDGKTRNAAMKNISAILNENKGECGKNQRIIFDSNDSFTTHSAGRTLLSICTTGKSNQTSSCDNFFYNNRKSG